MAARGLGDSDSGTKPGAKPELAAQKEIAHVQTNLRQTAKKFTRKPLRLKNLLRSRKGDGGRVSGEERDRPRPIISSAEDGLSFSVDMHSSSHFFCV